MQNLAATSPASSPSIHHHRRASSMRFAPRAAAVRYVPPPPPPSAPSGGTQGPAADNGFNFLSRADGHHLFDGGAAETYACRLTGRIHGHSGIARLLDPSRGHGAVVVHAGRLVAMMSGDDLRRHQVRVAYDFFYGQLGCAAMIAYPNKLDPASCDLFQFRRASQPTMIHHDFAFPENHDQVVVVVVFNLPEMFRGGSPVVLDDDRAKNTSRFAVLLPNYAADDASEVVVWVHVPDNCFFFFHLWMTRAGDYFSNDSDDHLCMANSRYHSATL